MAARQISSLSQFASPVRRVGAVETLDRAQGVAHGEGYQPISPSRSGATSCRIGAGGSRRGATAATRGLKDRCRRLSGDVEPGAESLADDFAGGGVFGFGALGEGGSEFGVEADWDDDGSGGAHGAAAAAAAQGFDVVAGFGFGGELVDLFFGDGDAVACASGG